MISPIVMRKNLALMRLMKHFPGMDAEAIEALIGELMSMCDTDKELDELTRELVREYDSWPGIAAVRTIAGRQQRPKESNLGTDPYCRYVPPWERIIDWKER